MAKYIDKSVWTEQILIPDEQTPILGGQPDWDENNMLSGWSNVPAGQLADRTRWLKQQLEEAQETTGGFLSKDSNLSDLQDIGQARYNLGLNLVTNTPDNAKPVSTLQQQALDTKVDKETGKGLSDVNFTTADKQKLDQVQEHYKGLFVDEAALVAGVASPVAGDYADVDAAAGVDVSRYLWDVNDNKWVKQAGEAAPLTASQVKTLYEANANTNAFTDAEKTKLTGVGSATKAQVLVGTDASKFVSPNTYTQVISWLDAGAVAATYNINLQSSLNHTATITEATTVALPTNMMAGKCGDIVLTLSAAVVVSWAVGWKFLDKVPDIKTSGEMWVVSYKVLNPTTVLASATKVAA